MWVFIKTTNLQKHINLKMQRIAARAISKTVLSAVGSCSSNASFSLQKAIDKPQGNCFANAAGDFLKWGSFGCFRNSSFASGFSPLQRKPLESIIDIERANTKSPEHLAEIWDDYHLGRGHIGASMKAKLYHLLEHRAANCRYFVIPLWRGSGYTTMFVQVQMPHIIITGLEDYKARGTQAAPYMTVSHYTEFAETKDLVLVRGDVVFTSKLTDEEAKWLIETTHSFYLNDTRFKLVERFNKETSEFEFKDVLRALDMPML